jgi:hypothetical protein
LVYPIAFNFRHAVELSIKHLNQVLPRLWGEQAPTEWTHRLIDNWQPVRLNLLRTSDFDPDGDLIPFVDDVLDDLLDIDPRGEVFRYPKANSPWRNPGCPLESLTAGR